MNSWIFFKVGRVNPDVRVPVEFQEYDTFHFRLLSSFFPVLQPFLAQGEHAKSSNGVVVLAKPIVPRENQAGNDGAHITGRVRDAAPVAPPEPIPKLF